MNKLTVTIPDDRLSKLQEIAARFRITPEDLVRVSIDELLARPEEDFRQAAEYVLNKNSELYRRLA
ncbi:MAG: DNA-binding protein [Deltaproteobacteria bacterium]|nr:DNA-binding protein [Deltaproteobacteria bacterium]